LQNAYLPALHRAGISKVGVFKPIAKEAKQAKDQNVIYVFIPFKSYEQFSKLEQRLAKDAVFQNDGKVYLDALYSEPAYERIESILLNAFKKSPKFGLPQLKGPMKDRVYELRSYEEHMEKISKNKIQMFNKGDEVGLFKRLNFNAVFYAEVVSDSRMPNLMYLTTYENRADRDAPGLSQTLAIVAEARDRLDSKELYFGCSLALYCRMVLRILKRRLLVQNNCPTFPRFD
jgi:hypothetical protein